MSLDDVSRVLSGNAAAVYGVDLDSLRPLTDRIGFDLGALVS